MKSNDRDPPLSLNIIQLVNGIVAPVDLSNKSVRVVMVTAQGRQLIFDEQAVIVDAQNGLIEYDWKEGNTSVPGSYLIVVHIIDNISGHTRSFPDNGYISLNIDPNYSSGLVMPAIRGSFNVFGSDAVLTVA